ncbi:MAG TPA: DMT family transporter [Roseiarcus sp.]|nr:DMT family transporter [Roseiarcus sp.]
MVQSSKPLDRFAVAVMLVLCASWGLQQISAKAALVDFAPITQAALRSIGASLAVGAFALWREPKIFRRDGSLLLGLLAGLIFAAEFIALFLAVQWTSASRVIVFLYSAPFFVALGAVLFLPQERLRLLQWLGLALSFSGVAVALSGAGGKQGLTGDLLAIFGAATWAMVTVMAKATGLRFVPPTKVLLYQLAVSAIVMTIAARIAREPWPAHVSAIGAASLIYQTFWVASATYLAWFWMLTRYRAGDMAAFTFVAPIVGVFAGHFLLGETLAPGFLLALALVAGGVLLVNWPARRVVKSPR